jgi:hypothetical protein
MNPRHALLSIVVALVAGAGLAPAAHAGTVGVTGTIRGAGSMLSTEGGPYTCTQTNGYNQNAASSCDRLAFEAAFEAFVWLRAVPSTVPAGNWAFGGWTGCDDLRTTAFGQECLVKSGAFSLNERFPTAAFVDTANPTVSLSSLPQRAPTSALSVSFSSPDPTAFFRCRIDNAASFTPCSPGTFTFADGPHTFRVIAVDPSGRTSQEAASNFITDTTAPVATISGGPAEGSRVNTRFASFTFGANESATFRCSLDNVTLAACASTLSVSGLGDGVHVVRLRANDGFRDGAVVTRTWTVDTTSPQLTITGGPANGGKSADSATFSFTANEAVTYSCQLDGGATAACDSGSVTYEGLSEASHTFTVTASDGLNPVTTATRTWAADLTAPQTTIASGPAAGSSVPTPSVTFEFAASEDATYECSIDGAAFAACTTPYATPDLPSGDHTLQVRAKDSAGNVDATPASRAWRTNVLDGDSDGFNRGVDCDDANAAVHPGATDVLDNRIDEDCDGADATTPPAVAVSVPAVTPVTPVTPMTPAAKPSISVTLSYFMRARQRSTTFSTLSVKGVPAGATVTVTCKGKCPKKRLKITSRRGGTVTLAAFRRKALKVGTTLTVSVTRSGMTGMAKILRVRASKRPSLSTKTLP